MKKICICFYLIFVTFIIYSTDYKIIKTTDLYDENLYKVGVIKKNEIVKKEGNFTISSENYKDRIKCKYLTEVFYKNKRFALDVESIIPIETKELFDKELLDFNLNENDKLWISKDSLDFLIKQDRYLCYEINKEKIDHYEDNRGEYDDVWYESEYYYRCPEIFFDNFAVHFFDLITSFDADILKISSIKNGYIVKVQAIGKTYNTVPNETYKLLPAEKEIVELKIIIDGDYMYVYNIEDKLLYTCLKVDKTVTEQYENLIRYNDCDITKIHWPYHEDGTSDYENYIVD